VEEPGNGTIYDQSNAEKSSDTHFESNNSTEGDEDQVAETVTDDQSTSDESDGGEYSMIVTDDSGEENEIESAHPPLDARGRMAEYEEECPPTNEESVCGDRATYDYYSEELSGEERLAEEYVDSNKVVEDPQVVRRMVPALANSLVTV